MSEPTHRAFQSLARSRYRYQLESDLLDSFTIGMYADDGGCEYEFEIQIMSLGGKPCMLLRVFDDAFDIFTKDLDLFAMLSGRAATSSDDLTKILLECGYADETPTRELVLQEATK